MTETPRNLIPPLSPTKQLILRLAAQVARLHDSEPEALDLIAEARAYLAQPEPHGPTDEELMALAVAVFENPCNTDKDYARAVLARYGHQRLTPIPLAECQPTKDEELLFDFYEASLSEGGDTDEVTLRGLRAVLARYGHCRCRALETLSDD